MILRDGSTLRLRVAEPDDTDALVSFFRGLSQESRYLRFQGAGTVEVRTVQPFARGDWPDSCSLLAERAPGAGETEVVALATFVRLRDPHGAEVAFAVADSLQGRGIGTRLLERLAAHAAAAGIEEFVAQVLPENVQMLRVFHDAGFAERRRLEGGVVEVSFDIAPTAEYREHVDERDHVAVVASLQPFFTPSRVAVIGASARRGTIGGELFRNILGADFAGAAYPVNMKGEAVGGVPAYTAVEDVPGDIDLAVICVPASAVLAHVKAK